MHHRQFPRRRCLRVTCAPAANPGVHYMQCENMEARSVGGAEIDLDTYGQLSDRIGRACQRLGLKRVAKELPDLRKYNEAKR